MEYSKEFQQKVEPHLKEAWNTELGKQYSKNLEDLYKLSIILQSRVCSNPELFSHLLLLKAQEFETYRSEMLKQISSMDSEQLQDFMNQFKDNHVLTWQNPKEIQEFMEWIDNAIEVAKTNPEQTKERIVSGVFGSIRGYGGPVVNSKNWEAILNTLSEEEKQQLSSIDIDTELQKVFDTKIFDKVTAYSNYTNTTEEVYKENISAIEHRLVYGLGLHNEIEKSIGDTIRTATEKELEKINDNHDVTVEYQEVEPTPEPDLAIPTTEPIMEQDLNNLSMMQLEELQRTGQITPEQENTNTNTNTL